MYEKNEILVYGNNGVCRLTDIRRESFTDQPEMYYILSPVFDERSTIYIPTESYAAKKKLRRIMPKDKLDTMLVNAKNSDTKWETNERKRNEQFKTVTANGLSPALLEVLKSLTIQQDKLKQNVKKLHAADERTLAVCEKIIGEEYAYAFGVEVNDALSHIRSEFLSA